MLSLADLSLIENAQGTEPFTMIDNLLAPAPGDVPSVGGPSNDDASSCDTEDSESTDGAASCEDAAEAKQITPRNSNSDDEMDEDEWPEGVPRIEMPKLSSNLAQVCSLSVSIQEAVESRWLGPPPPGPVLQSELGKRCELQVRVPPRVHGPGLASHTLPAFACSVAGQGVRGVQAVQAPEADATVATAAAPAQSAAGRSRAADEGCRRGVVPPRRGQRGTRGGGARAGLPCRAVPAASGQAAADVHAARPARLLARGAAAHRHTPCPFSISRVSVHACT